jgi:hypothetical protein
MQKPPRVMARVLLAALQPAARKAQRDAEDKALPKAAPEALPEALPGAEPAPHPDVQLAPRPVGGVEPQQQGRPAGAVRALVDEQLIEEGLDQAQLMRFRALLDRLVGRGRPATAGLGACQLGALMP